VLRELHDPAAQLFQAVQRYTDALRSAAEHPPSSPARGPPTASIPKTCNQPEEPNSKRSRPCGNNASTGRSRVPPTREQMRGPTSDRQHPPHSVQGTTGSVRTKNPNSVPAGRQRPADSTPQASSRGAQNMRLHVHAVAEQAAARCRIRRLQIKGRASPGRAACVLASLLGRAVSCSSGMRNSAFIRSDYRQLKSVTFFFSATLGPYATSPLRSAATQRLGNSSP
jgi:hypothetical protein